jgi:hypothetical protein
MSIRYQGEKINKKGLWALRKYMGGEHFQNA